MNIDSSPLSTLDQTVLGNVVRQALRRDTAEVVDWSWRSIHAAYNPVTGGLYRLTGTARDRSDLLAWSVVLKIVRSADQFGRTTNDPASPSYWRREPLLYQSGLLTRLPPCIVAPQCYDVTEPTPGTAWIWQEDIVESVESPWPIERYGLAARHLGAFNGAYLVDWPLPTEDYLSRGWSRAGIALVSPLVTQLASVREHPLLRRGWSSALLDRVQRIVDEREIFLSAQERLPLTFCHRDAFRGNLLARRRSNGQEETVAIDWAFAGLGCLGADLAPLVAASVTFFHVEPEQLRELDLLVFEGYLAGLRDAGWNGDPRLARLGYTSTAALRYGMFSEWVAVVNADHAASLERATGHPLAEILDRSAVAVSVLCDYADEARELMRALFDAHIGGRTI